MSTYEVIIKRYSSIKVEADSKRGAIREANNIINADEEIDCAEKIEEEE